MKQWEYFTRTSAQGLLSTFRNCPDIVRQWRYCDVDALFSSATHYVIKCNDQDDFSMAAVGQEVFVYAHGDTRTYKRLRGNIQQGKPIVMLHNSGGVVTAFSWLQRVMAHTRRSSDGLRSAAEHPPRTTGPAARATRLQSTQGAARA